MIDALRARAVIKAIRRHRPTRIEDVAGLPDLASYQTRVIENTIDQLVARGALLQDAHGKLVLGEVGSWAR